MCDYMRALEGIFTPKARNAERHQELKTYRQVVATLLDKQRRKKLLRLLDVHAAMQEELALNSFIAGFRLL